MNKCFSGNWAFPVAASAAADLLCFAGKGSRLLLFAACLFGFSPFILAQDAAPAAGADPASAPDRAVSEKIAAIKGEKEIAKRGKLYRELGEVRDGAATAALSQAALTEPEPGARIDAVMALRKIGGPGALKGLLEALAAEKHNGVRIQTVNSLGFFDAPEALARLREIAKNDPDKDLRISAVMALSRLNDTGTLAAGFDTETDSNVKLGIIDALGRADGGEKEIGRIKTRNKDAKLNKKLNFYTREKAKPAAKTKKN